MRYRAYSPGSITLFFRIVDSPDPQFRGSQGVGFSVSPGAVTEVRHGPEKIVLNGEEVDGQIQRYVADAYGFRGRIETRIYLPLSQGFGMSGAIALSTSLALASMFRKTYYHAVKIAHEAELMAGTGLGDVASEFTGGMTLRLRGGVPPHGWVDRIPYTGPVDVKLLVFDEPIVTGTIIGDEVWADRIKRYGSEAMEEILRDPSFENALRIARKFAFNLGLVKGELEEFLRRCENATMALIGNSAIVFGDCKLPVPEHVRAYDVSPGVGATILR